MVVFWFVVVFLLVDITVSQDCPSNKVLDSASGSVSSPSYPSNYPANQSCSWVIQAPKGKHVKLTFLNFNVQDCGSMHECTCDYLIVAIGKDATKRSHKYCQYKLANSFKKTDLSKPIYSVYNEIWLTFYSNNEPSNHYKGFNATYELLDYTPPVCPKDAVVYTENSGVISSPNYPSNYPELTHCYWLITVTPNSRIKLTFTNFTFEETGCRYEPSRNCTCDYLQVYDGSNNATLAELCDAALPKPIVSGSNKILIEFFSGSYVSPKHKRNFQAIYNVTSDTPSPTIAMPTSSKPPNSGRVLSTDATETLLSVVLLLSLFYANFQ